jgi:hypothetical protein
LPHLSFDAKLPQSILIAAKFEDAHPRQLRTDDTLRLAGRSS